VTVAFVLFYSTLLTKKQKPVYNLWKNILHLGRRLRHGMGRRGITTAILMALIMCRALSQELSHQVLVPAAGVISLSTVDLSQTIGETAVMLFTTDEFALTQGFQQPSIVFNDVPPLPGTLVKVYPSPVSDILTVEFSGETDISYVVTIVNMYGSMVSSKELNFTGSYWYKLEVPVDGLSSGLYLVNVRSRDRTIKRTFKIEKL
jgi:hypothetical protein